MTNGSMGQERSAQGQCPVRFKRLNDARALLLLLVEFMGWHWPAEGHTAPQHTLCLRTALCVPQPEPSLIGAPARSEGL